MDRFDEVIVKTQLIVLRIDSNGIQKFSEFFVIFGEFGHKGVGLREVVEILKVEFEKVHLLLNFVEYDFIVSVALRLAEYGGKKKFIQRTDFFYV